MSRPKLVGITGGIGSGKTTVCKIFETLGHQVYYADDRARSLMESDEQLIADIKALFGDVAYQMGKLNRSEIAKQVFGNKPLLNQLNNAVHPAVKRDFESWIKKNAEQKLLFKEAALLVETGSYKELDFLILVVADEESKVDRVIKRDPHRSREDVKKIIAQQLPDEKKAPLANSIIKNDDSESLIEQVMDIYSSF